MVVCNDCRARRKHPQYVSVLAHGKRSWNKQRAGLLDYGRQPLWALRVHNREPLDQPDRATKVLQHCLQLVIGPFQRNSELFVRLLQLQRRRFAARIGYALRLAQRWHTLDPSQREPLRFWTDRPIDIESMQCAWRDTSETRAQELAERAQRELASIPRTQPPS